MADMFYRILAAYKARFHDPDLKMTGRVWSGSVVVLLIWSRVRWGGALPYDTFGWGVLAIGALFVIDAYQRYLSGSSVARAGVFCVSVAAAAVVGFKVAGGRAALLFAVPFFGGTICGFVLLAVALLRNGETRDEG